MRHVVLFLIILSVSGCGTLTGIPGHGGGKRFAVEQELVSATVRAAIMDIDVSSLRNKKVTTYINSIGDTGSGNLIGGRPALSAVLQRQFVSVPTTIERSTFPVFTNQSQSAVNSSSSSNSNANSSTEQGNSSRVTSSSTSSTRTNENQQSSTNQTTNTTNQVVSSAPGTRITSQAGNGSNNEYGLTYQGLGAYQNSDRIAPAEDIQFLSAVFESYLFLNGVQVVPPSESEIDLYLTVDVFGTVRSQVDWLLANNEVLRSKTSLEVFGVDSQTGKLVLSPQRGGSVAEYNEQYLLWVGPVKITKKIVSDSSTLCSFDNFNKESCQSKQRVPIFIPFKDNLKRK